MASIPSETLTLRGASASGGECTYTPAPGSAGLWPLQLTCAWLDGNDGRSGFSGAIKEGDSAFVLRLDHPSRKVATGDPGELTVFISGSLGRSLAAVETLLTEVNEIRLVACDGSGELTIESDSLRVEGLAPSERVLPTDAALHDGALAMEYLNYPRRFCFIRLSNLHCPRPTSAFYVVLRVPRAAGPALAAVEHCIHLNCLPIVNLYKTPPVALKLKGHRDDYLIARSDSRHVHWDVYDVLRLRLTGSQAQTEVPEFHAGFYGQLPRRKMRMWQGARTERQSTSLAHGSMSIRLINVDNAAQSGDIYDLALLDILCTNCDAPQFMDTGMELQINGWECGYRSTLEVTATKYVPALSPTQLSICEVLGALHAEAFNLRQLLKAYCRNDTEFSSALIACLGPVSSDVVAVPWQGLSYAAMVPAVRYSVDLRDAGKDVSGIVLLGQVIAKLLSQRHDHRMPMQVQLALPGGKRVECAA
jgi:type VI protein secretion system component VasA